MYKIVIVEDEHLIRKWLSLAIDYSFLGMEVVGLASHGQEGMELIQRLQPDVVMTDINMPIMDAFMMFEATRQLSYEKIILSGYNDFENARKAMQFGACDFISKPIDAAELCSCLQTIAERLRQKEQGKSLLSEKQQGSLDLPKVENPIAQDLLSWVHQHYREHFTISDIALDLNYSESYLYKIIKENLPMTLNEYILHYRLNQAIEVMSHHPEVKNYELAQQIGFADYKYFGKVFKQKFGVTPKEFRESKIMKGE